jgi:hypothetical protein
MPSEKLPALTKYRCTICDSKLREGRYVYSRFTKNRYCIDFAGHAKLAAKKKRQQRQPERVVEQHHAPEGQLF